MKLRDKEILQVKRLNHNGLSLLEIVVIMGLFSLILVLALGIFPSSLSALKRSGMYHAASGLAKIWIEDAASSPPPAALLGSVYEEAPQIQTVNGIQMVVQRCYHNADVRWQSGSPELFDVVVTVWWDPSLNNLSVDVWKTAKGRMHNVSYTIRVYHKHIQ